MSKANNPQLQKVYEETIKRLSPAQASRPVHVEFYPYVNPKHTIRVREGEVFVRISDSLVDAPDEVHFALAEILAGKLLKKLPSEKSREVFRSYIERPEYVDIILENKTKRGRKQVGSPVGNRFDLDELFNRLNAAYFDSKLERPRIGWSAKRTFRRLGHFDPVHNTIIISRTLDARGVPEYVTAFVLFHEMLHMIFPAVVKNGKRYPHTREFKEAEMAFEFFEEAEEWIASTSLKKLASAGY